MKVIGLLGGMGWESSAEYYRIINREVRAQLGGQHSAECILYSLDFHEIKAMQHQNRWEDLTQILKEAAQNLQSAGADLLLLCTNTMHLVAPQVQQAIDIPLIHIVDTTARDIKRRNMKQVGLLGTRFTMEEEFYRSRLSEIHHISAIVPDKGQREIVHRIIYDELTNEEIREESRTQVVDIIESLVNEGGEGVILGCTELPMLIRSEDVSVPVLNTTLLHAQEAVAISIEELFE